MNSWDITAWRNKRRQYLLREGSSKIILSAMKYVSEITLRSAGHMESISSSLSPSDLTRLPEALLKGDYPFFTTPLSILRFWVMWASIISLISLNAVVKACNFLRWQLWYSYMEFCMIGFSGRCGSSRSFSAPSDPFNKLSVVGSYDFCIRHDGLHLVWTIPPESE